VGYVAAALAAQDDRLSNSTKMELIQPRIPPPPLKVPCVFWRVWEHRVYELGPGYFAVPCFRPADDNPTIRADCVRRE